MNNKIDLQQSGTFQVICPTTFANQTTGAIFPKSTTIAPVRLNGLYKLKLNYIEFISQGRNINIAQSGPFVNAALVCFTSPNFNVPLTGGTDVSVYEPLGPPFLKGTLATANGFTTIFSYDNYGASYDINSNLISAVKGQISRPGPEHWVIADIQNSLSITPQYCTNVGQYQWKTVEELWTLFSGNYLFGVNNSAWVLTFQYEKI